MNYNDTLMIDTTLSVYSQKVLVQQKMTTFFLLLRIFYSINSEYIAFPKIGTYGTREYGTKWNNMVLLYQHGISLSFNAKKTDQIVQQNAVPSLFTPI